MSLLRLDLYDLYDLYLDAQFLSDRGGECPVCGEPFPADEEVVHTDAGEAHAIHLLHRPEECYITEPIEGGGWSVVLGTQQLGVVRGEAGAWFASTPGGTSGGYPSKATAARAVVAYTYPEGE